MRLTVNRPMYLLSPFVLQADKADVTRLKSSNVRAIDFLCMDMECVNYLPGLWMNFCRRALTSS